MRPPTRSGRSSRNRRSARRCTTSSPTRRTSASTSSELPGRVPGEPVRTTTTVVIGGGHGGLAMSRCLSDRSIDHVVLERGEVANSWRRERWDSLRLLTPNWLTRLPGHRYEGADPDGFMTMAEVIDFMSRFAAAAAAPVRTNTAVTSVTRTGEGYHVATANGGIGCRTLVLA